MTDSWWSSTEAVAVPAGRRVRGRASPPPSKSLTHRSFNAALLAARPTFVERPLEAEDTTLFLAALERLGCRVERGREGVAIDPAAARTAGGELFCGNAGTMLRLLTASLATRSGHWRVDGVARLHERPVGPLVDALRALGARIDYLGEPGFAPLAVHGATLEGGSTRLDASQSSQYLSALLMAATQARREVEIAVEGLVSAPYVELTLDLLMGQGARIARPAEHRFRVVPSELAGGRLAVEPDLSAAAYPAAAAALAGGEILLAGVSLASRQGDRRLLEILAAMGASVEPTAAGVRVAGGGLVAFDADLADVPDQVPTLAALAPFARGTTRIRNVAHLRLKESDRLAAMAGELRRAGATVEELADGLVIAGIWAAARPPEAPVTVDPHGDHRIAMAMALVGLRRPGLRVAEPGCVAKSYPTFWRELAGWLGEPG